MTKKFSDQLFDTLVEIATVGNSVEKNIKANQQAQQEANDQGLTDIDRYNYVCQRTDDLLGVFDKRCVCGKIDCEEEYQHTTSGF